MVKYCIITVDEEYEDIIKALEGVAYFNKAQMRSIIKVRLFNTQHIHTMDLYRINIKTWL